jgi:FkbM family methyltransferase
VASHERLRKLAKAARLAKVRRFRRAGRHGVAAAIEHDVIPLRSDIRTVIDVGSNRGQFAVLALARFPLAQLICFEPLPEPRKVLQKITEGDGNRVDIVPYAAAAHRNLSMRMHVSKADDASSLLPIGKRQIIAFPGTEEQGVEEVVAVRIDEVVHSVDEPCLMKIDVQGYELPVLQGAERLLPNITHLLIECSFAELYRGQALAGKVIAYLIDCGYQLTGIYGVKRDREGHCLCADFLFEQE